MKDTGSSFGPGPSPLSPMGGESSSQTFFKEELIYNENDFMNDALSANNELVSTFFESLILCHYARTIYQADTGKFAYQTNHAEEETLLEFAKRFDFIFERSNRPDNPSLYDTTIHGKKVQFGVLGLNDFTHGRKRFSLVIRHPDQKEGEGAVLLAKGPDASMKNIIDFENDAEREHYNKTVARIVSKGLKPYVLARRAMKEEETNSFYRSYQNFKTSLLNQAEGLEALATETETKLELMAIIGFKDELRPGA